MFKHDDFFMMRYEWYRNIPRKEVKIGSKFGKWTVISNIRYKNPDWDYDPDALWQCECECGRHRQLTSIRLNIIVRNHEERGWEDGCGWCTYEKNKGEKSDAWKLHKKLYQTWANLRQRCNNPNNPMYKDYGGRGIKVFPEWNTHFKSFYDYVSTLPKFGDPGMTLDRVNNDEGYFPGNVRWATQKEQCNNRRPRKKKGKE